MESVLRDNISYYAVDPETDKIIWAQYCVDAAKIKSSREE
eukprot:CAMPEP_0202959576 /NCGR_PEP_ID=MMETSP1396-20130829/3761_1 /ASSEMBLY_ACC=CAM_ASM_000872 /TAXON_ID= /ORGANISM="Pseudokeronopsis sp., Strain Brazil" /LENGTH=39 /DNA_ID= /DNA_START= /DNA_END= /DNA_ORIENTATION=